MMRANPTKTEKILWNALRHDQLGVRIRRQYPMHGRILDFYVPSHRLAIEVDGPIHVDTKKEDDIRDAFLDEEYGIFTIRFTNAEIENDLPSVINQIQKHLHPPPPAEEGLGVEESMG